ncbi:glycosyltransferase family 2 protein [Caviibacterium pharyngocola]|uniref:Glycosyltransferase n=1 Tax=Caviibacterium pharyngocola TaxID=28159 RepID=A0A2M8RTJ3_9PAST|nr:glycosyltransferase family 2 protein [Caviibacterium pharyngocola]PJG82213.1 glycosyltransferase [Caviibacterium pharyngocola]
MFSIIVPSYNRKTEIPPLLDSLTKQTDLRFEVIIVDDCSAEPVDAEQHYPFSVTVIRNAQNQGAAQSRNIGASNARYDWLLFLDDDDRFAETKCAELAQAIEANPTANFIYHPAQCTMVNEGFGYITRPYSNPADLTLDNMLSANKIGGMPMIGVKKAFFFAIGGLSRELKSLEDYEFVLKAVSATDFNPIYVPTPLTHCSFHTKRASVSTNTTNTQSAITEIEKNYVRSAQQRKNFALNAQYMLAYPNIMNLSRRAAKYYFAMFKLSGNLKSLIIAIITLISPSLAINLKRFI